MYNKVEIRRFFCAKKSARVTFNQCPGASIENLITSLDASTACDVMKILKDLSKNGCTIVFSIHQPRTATALEPFIKERALFIHENVSGYYSMSTCRCDRAGPHICHHDGIQWFSCRFGKCI
ncbi:unnamed protein product [Rotaria sordida]|uniref:Uncharacterized protein n=1 Tax=Rotaria sordida TaxID=392033 RepID=A0A814HBQ1_9BILA|nr:unnamed protein product [Rotaria sordida]